MRGEGQGAAGRGSEEKEAIRKRRQEKETEREIRELVELDRKTHLVARASQIGDSWDVTGEYRITCKEITSGYSDCKDLSLSIYRSEDTASQTAQLYGKMNFGILEGWFRFETKDVLHATMASFVKVGQKRKRDNERAEARKRSNYRGPQYYGDSSDEEDSEDEEDPKQFLLRVAERPSATSDTWNFLWRAQTTAESYWTTGDDEASHLTFHGRGGSKIQGKLLGDYPFDFTGVKIKMGTELAKRSTARLAKKWKYLDMNNYGAGRRW